MRTTADWLPIKGDRGQNEGRDRGQNEGTHIRHVDLYVLLSLLKYIKFNIVIGSLVLLTNQRAVKQEHLTLRNSLQQVL
jgi:hypothetical protein